MSSQNYTPGFSFAADLESALSRAADSAGLDRARFRPEVRVSEPAHGDYQANGALAYAKEEKANPRALAERLVAALDSEIRAECKPSIAGPGFVNFSLSPGVLLEWLVSNRSESDLKTGAGKDRAGQTWVVDYSAPNTAKQMHVGHLRSAVIGEAICRLFEFSGAKVIRDNHVGDWGTQFGKLIWAYKRHLDKEALGSDPIEEFERLYKIGNSTAESDPAVMDQARAELVKLQSGDPDNAAIWKRINEASLEAFQQIYDRLGIRFDVSLGESFFQSQVDRIYRELSESGLAVESEGALVVFHPEHPRFAKQPFIVRKKDGAANYATTDLATLLYRAEQFKAKGVIYIVDSRQRDHFDQLFLTARKWFSHFGRTLPEVCHVDFGTVLGEDGKPLKTRSGENIRLKDLLAEAVERAFALVTEKNPQLSEDERRAISETVGIGSVQYADLSQNRSSDYVFSWDKMISFEGNTAAYLLYAVARLHSIFRREGLDPYADEPEPRPGPPQTAAETALARKLVKFADAVRLAVGTLRPHFVCLYLYELAGEFSAFYDAEKVLVEDREVRARRLLLCRRTLVLLETGLHLLGLRTLKRM